MFLSFLQYELSLDSLGGVLLHIRKVGKSTQNVWSYTLRFTRASTSWHVM